MDQGCWEYGRGERGMCAILLSSTYVICIYSVLSLCAKNRNCPSRLYPIDHMANFPSNSQRPLYFHPEFDREVFAVVFSVSSSIPDSSWLILNISKVEGQGFKVDATRLTAHSKFLRDMLFDKDGFLGTGGEGTPDKPIILQGCTAERFANFLRWLNHECVVYCSYTYSLLT